MQQKRLSANLKSALHPDAAEDGPLIPLHISDNRTAVFGTYDTNSKNKVARRKRFLGPHHFTWRSDHATYHALVLPDYSNLERFRCNLRTDFRARLHHGKDTCQMCSLKNPFQLAIYNDNKCSSRQDRRSRVCFRAKFL